MIPVFRELFLESALGASLIANAGTDEYLVWKIAAVLIAVSLVAFCMLTTKLGGLGDDLEDAPPELGPGDEADLRFRRRTPPKS